MFSSVQQNSFNRQKGAANKRKSIYIIYMMIYSSKKTYFLYKKKCPIINYVK